MKTRTRDRLPFSVKTVPAFLMRSAVRFIVGFVFANAVVSDSFAPFGIAAAVNGDIFTLAGCVVGHFFAGRDITRSVVAVCVAFVAKRLLSPVVSVRGGVLSVMCSLWAMIVSGAVGLFTSHNDLRENIFFVIGGLLGSIASYYVCCAFETVEGKSPVSRSVGFFSCVLTWSVFCVGMLGMGEATSYAAVILTVALLCRLLRRGGVFFASTAAMVVALIFCLHDPEELWLAGVIVVGTIAGSILRNVSDFAVILGFALANVLVYIYSGGGYDLIRMLICVVSAGVLSWLIPQKTEDRFVALLIPKRSSEKKTPVFRPRKYKAVDAVGKRIRTGADDEAIERICSKCKKRILCWVKNYDDTVRNMNMLRANRVDPETAIDPDFERVCPNVDIFLRNLREDGKTVKNGIYLDTVRVYRSKNGQTECGDTNCGFDCGENKYALCIVDGMGSGKTAAEQSRRVSAAVKTMISRGVPKNDIMDMVNNALYNGREDSVLSFDLMIVDLDTAQCEMLKADACPTFVCRDGSVYCVGRRSLPLGADEIPDAFASTCILCDGDVLVMVSDGFAGEGEDFCIDILQKCVAEKHDPLGFAAALIDTAVNSGLADGDDLTVIVSKVRAKKNPSSEKNGADGKTKN